MLNKNILIPSLLVFLASLLILSFAEQESLVFIAKFLLVMSLVVPVCVLVLHAAVGKQKTKAFLANLLLMFASLAMVLFVGELFTRYLYKDITTTSDNASYFALKWKSDFPPVINNLGFREREIDQQKPENVYRIAVIGDSFAYGQGILEEERFSNIIEQTLNASKGGYEILNFGKPGAETVDQLSFLEDILELNPDFILLQWFTNDVEGHDKSARPRPYRLIPSDYLTGLLHRNSALFYLASSRWNLVQSELGLVDSYVLSMDGRFADPKSADSRRANAELMEFISRVKASNIPLGIVMFPKLVNTSGDIAQYPFGYLFERVLDTCRKNNVRCLDLRPVFTNITPVSELWVNKFDHHPSAFANELAAEAILKTFSDQW